MRRLLLFPAAALLLAGCGSHFQLERIAPAQTMRGHVVVPDRGKLGALRTGVAISFPTPSRGFLATKAETLRRTDDGGRTWHTLAVGFPFVSLTFVSPRAGFGLATRGNVFSTHDGGRSWRLLHDFGGGALTGTIQFVDALHGWASLGGERVYSTSDGGASWSQLTLPCRNSAVAVSFVDDSSGFLVCGGGAGAGSQQKDFYATADGGQTWKHRGCSRGFRPGCTSDLPGSGYVGRLDFSDAQKGLLVTDRGGISRTLDGGRSWAQTLLTDDEWFVSSTSWASRRTVYALSFPDSSLIRSDDAGAHWRHVTPRGPGVPTGAVSFSSPRNGIGLGSSRILVPDGVSATTDGGVTWRHVADLAGVDDAQLVRSGPHVVWALGFRTSWTGATRAHLLRSGDEGRRWQRRPYPHGLGIGATLSFPTEEVGFVAGSKALFRTDDGGSSWQRVQTRREDLLGAVFVTPREGLLAEAGGLLRSGDGGRSWSPVRVKSTVLSGPFVLDARHWWLEGRNTLLRTADGGRSWTAIRLPASGLTSLDFVTPNVGYSVASDGGFYRTSDGGRNWHLVQTR